MEKFQEMLVRWECKSTLYVLFLLAFNDEITEDKLIMLFSQPNDKRTYSSSITYLYNADPSWTTTNYYKIVVVDGIIDELTLDNR